MSVRVLYFANLREAMGSDGEIIDLPPHVSTTGALRAFLAARGDASAALGQMQSLRCAVNQQMTDWQAVIADGDEVAFFPPVTGG